MCARAARVSQHVDHGIERWHTGEPTGVPYHQAPKICTTRICSLDRNHLQIAGVDAELLSANIDCSDYGPDSVASGRAKPELLFLFERDKYGPNWVTMDI